MRAGEPSQVFLSTPGPYFWVYFWLDLSYWEKAVQGYFGHLLVVLEIEKSVAICFSSPSQVVFVMCLYSANLFLHQG